LRSRLYRYIARGLEHLWMACWWPGLYPEPLQHEQAEDIFLLESAVDQAEAGASVDWSEPAGYHARARHHRRRCGFCGLPRDHGLSDPIHSDPELLWDRISEKSRADRQLQRQFPGRLFQPGPEWKLAYSNQ